VVGRLALATVLAAPLIAAGLDAAWAETRDSVAVDWARNLAVGVDPLGEMRAPTLGPHPGSHGSTLVVDPAGLLVVERDAGVVVRASREGEPKAALELSRGLGEIVRDARNNRVFVADRGGHRVVEIAPGDAEGRGLALRATAMIREPHGLALSPDGHTLLATSVADHELVAFDLRDAELKPSWRLKLAPEPRGVAISPDGHRAIVGFVSLGAVALIDLPGQGREQAKLGYRSLEPRDHLRFEIEEFEGFTETHTRLVEAKSRFEVPSETGRRYARNTFALGFVGHGIAVAPHQLATPQLMRRPPDTGTYGGGESFSPITHAMAMISEGVEGIASSTPLRRAALGVHMPRALSYDLARDTLYVGGYGDDAIQAIGRVSQPALAAAWKIDLADFGKQACGIDGLAVEGDVLWVHCEFGRSLVRVEIAGPETREDNRFEITRGPELTASMRDPEVERGAEIFRRAGDSRLTLDGQLACAQCHPEGRSDGLSWRLEGAILQTPMLAGRLVGTKPYKWDGQDPNLDASLHNTIGRLGGFPDAMRRRELRALRAYLESLAPPHTPTPRDPGAVARGRAVFESPEAACDACHEGGRLSDGQRHELDTSLRRVDTPSLIGLAHSAPYYHDGSAQTLDALLANRSTIHDMADTSALTPEQIADLIAYLESL
jgi:mono/diheme cytochrome c family protein